MSHPFYLLLPAQMRKRCNQLYQQQMWAWGQDIRHAEGNLLLKYGFYKECGPTPQNRASQYVLQIETDLAWKLWSFGTALEGLDQGLLLPRHSFRPRCYHGTLPRQMNPAKLPQAQPLLSPEEQAQALNLLAINLHLFAKYEAWIFATQGAPYRQEVMARQPEKTLIPASEMAGSWQALSESVSELHNALRSLPAAA